MKKLISVLFLLVTIFGSAYAQCNYNGVPGKLKRYCVSDAKPTPDVATRLILFFDRFYFVGQVGFAKAGDQYYMYMHLARNYSKRFDLRATDGLVLTTSSGKEIAIFPSGDYSGKKMITWFAVGGYYQLSKEQLDILATEHVESLKLYVTPEDRIETKADDPGNGWHEEANGKIYFKQEIGAEERNEKCKAMAQCLQAKI